MLAQDRRPDVIELLQTRQADDYQVGRDDDGHEIGIAVDGGGMAGVTNGGMVAELAERGLLQRADRLIGISAGAIDAAAALAGQAALIRSVYVDRLAGNDFIRLRRLFRRGETIVRPDVLGDILATELDTQAIFDNPTKLSFGVTNLSECRPYTVRTDDPASTPQDLPAWLMIGAHLPLAAGPAVRHPNTLNGDDNPSTDLWCDGGLSHPSTEMLAMHEGCTDILTLANRPLQPWSINRRNVLLVAHWMRQQYRAEYGNDRDPGSSFVSFSILQKKHIDALRNGEYAPRVSILVIAPPGHPNLPEAFTMNPEKLKQGYDLGRHAVSEAVAPRVSSLPVEAVPALVVPRIA